MSLRPALALTAVLALAGCTVGPHYRTPSLAPVTPQTFAEANAASTSAPPPGRWWALYRDPALDALVEKALVHNTDLRQAAANLEAAEGALAAARAPLFPSTSLSGSTLYGRGTTSGGSGGTAGSAASTGSGSGPAATGDQSGASSGNAGLVSGSNSAPNQVSYTGGVTTAYDLDLFGRIHRAVDAARADVEALAAARDLARTATAADTTRAYVSACANAQQAEVARQSLGLLTQSLQIVGRQRDLGSASDYDVANVRTLAEQARAAVPPLEAGRRSALYALAVLTGEPPERVSAEAAACLKPPPLVTPVPVGDGARLLARRPDVREAERRLAAATHRIDVATADLYPTVTLLGRVFSTQNKSVDFGSRNGTSFSLGPVVSWTFPNILAARGQIARSTGDARAQLAAFDGAVLTALREVEQALATYGGELDRRDALFQARNASAEAYRLANIRAQNGSISLLDALTIQRTLVTAEATLAASDAALADDQITLFRALGGGWEDAPAVEVKPIPQKGR